MTSPPPPNIRHATEHLRRGLAELAELERHSPAEVTRVLEAVIAHVRSWKPDAIGYTQPGEST